MSVHVYGDGPLLPHLLLLASSLQLIHTTYTNINTTSTYLDPGDIDDTDIITAATKFSSRSASDTNVDVDIVDVDGSNIKKSLLYFHPHTTDVFSVLAAGDVLVNAKVRGETFGYIHVEAALMTTPVLAFDRWVYAYKNTYMCIYI